MDNNQHIYVRDICDLPGIVAGLVREGLAFNVRWDSREDAWDINITGY